MFFKYISFAIIAYSLRTLRLGLRIQTEIVPNNLIAAWSKMFDTNPDNRMLHILK